MRNGLATATVVSSFHFLRDDLTLITPLAKDSLQQEEEEEEEEEEGEVCLVKEEVGRC